MINRRKETTILLLLIVFTIPNLYSQELLHRIYGWRTYGQTEETTEGYDLSEVKLRFPSMMGGQTVTFPQIKVSRDHEILGESKVVLEEPISLLTNNGLGLEVSALEFKAEGPFGPGLYIEGKFEISSKDGIDNLLLESLGTSFYMDNNGLLNFKSVKSVSFNLFGHKMAADKLYIGKLSESGHRTGMVAENVKLIPEDYKSELMEDLVTFPRISFYFSGEFGEMEPSTTGKIYIGRTVISNSLMKVEDKVLKGKGWIRLPGMFNSIDGFISEFEIYSGSGLIAHNISFSRENNINKAMVNFREGELNSGNEIELYRVNLIFPGAFDNEKIETYSMTIDHNGDAKLDNVSPQEFMKESYYPKEISGTKNRVNITGRPLSGGYDQGTTFTLVYNTMGFTEKFFLTMPEGEVKTIFELPDSSELKYYSALQSGDKQFLNKWTAGKQPTDIIIDDVPVLIDRIKDEDIESVKWLIENGGEINLSYKGKSALYYSLKEDNQDIVELLLDNGAQPSLIPDGESNPLQLALSDSKIDIAERLLGGECNLDLTNNENYSMFDYLMRVQDKNLIRKGLDRGIKPVPGASGSHPLQLIMWWENYKEYLDLYLEKGFSPDDEIDRGFTILEYAISSNREVYAMDLIDLIPDKDFKGEKYSPALVQAIERKLNSIAVILLNKGVTPSGRDRKGNSIYTLIVENNSPELMELAGEKGLVIPMEKAGVAELKYKKRGDDSWISNIIYNEKAQKFYGFLRSREDRYTLLDEFITVPVDLDFTEETESLPFKSFTASDNQVLLKTDKNGDLYIGTTKPRLERLSGMDIVISRTDEQINNERDNVVWSDTRDVLLDFYPMDSDGEPGMLLTVNGIEQNRLYNIDITSTGGNTTKNALGGEGRGLDGAIRKTGEGNLIVVLREFNDNFYLDVITDTYKRFRIGGDLIPVEDRDQEWIHLSVAENNGNYSCLVSSKEELLLLSISLEEDVQIVNQTSLLIDGLRDSLLLERDGTPIVITGKSYVRNPKTLKQNSKDSAIWLIELDDNSIPVSGFSVKLDHSPIGLSASSTDKGGIGIVTNKYSGDYTYDYSTFIKFDETVSGVSGSVIYLPELMISLMNLSP